MQGRTATTRPGVTRKEVQEKITRYIFVSVSKKPTGKRCLLILDLKPHLDHGERKIMQSIRITSRPSWRKRKWNQFSQV